MEATVSSVGWGWRSQPSRRSISHLWGSSTILERSLHVRLWETVIALHGLIDSVDSVCALNFDRPASSANHSLWHSKMKYSCCRFLNIQTCARCRPNFTDLCLRVTESPDEIFTALPRVPQTPKLCPRFYDRGLNLDKSFTSFGTSCKRWNCKTLRRVKSHQKFSKVSGTAVSLFDSSSRSRFLSDFMIFVNICEIFVNRKAILEIKPGRSVRAG